MNQEALLMDLIRAGDARAFETIVRQYDQRLLAVARRYLRQGEDSADAVQDALLSAYLSVGSFRGDSTLWTWLYRILVNACLTIRRSRYRRRMVSFEDLPRGVWEDGRQALLGARATEAAYSLAERAEVQAQVRSCIARLPKRYREVLRLRHLEELDTDQTAQRLGTSPGAVKTRLHRARQALRATLERDPRCWPRLAQTSNHKRSKGATQ
jgi:RNA polymerase sigma-70 factor (ECF subfamily)